MYNEIVVSFLSNKHKTLVSYARTLYGVLDVVGTSLWLNEDEYLTIVSNILKMYVDKYYLRDDDALSLLNGGNRPDNKFRKEMSQALILDYYGSDYDSVSIDFGESINELRLIVYLVISIDKDITFYDKNKVSLINIERSLVKLFIDYLDDKRVNRYPFLFEVLSNKINDSERKEIRFFESLKLDSDSLLFKKLGDDYYTVKYNLCILDEDEESIDGIINNGKIDKSIFSLLNQLVTLTLLKGFSNNCLVPTLLVELKSIYLYDRNLFTELLNLYSNNYIRDKVLFVINYNDYVSNKKAFGTAEEYGLNFIIRLESGFLNYDTLIDKYPYLITDDLEDDLIEFELDYIIDEDEDYINDFELFSNLIVDGDNGYE